MLMFLWLFFTPSEVYVTSGFIHRDSFYFYFPLKRIVTRHFISSKTISNSYTLGILYIGQRLRFKFEENLVVSFSAKTTWYNIHRCMNALQIWLIHCPTYSINHSHQKKYFGHLLDWSFSQLGIIGGWRRGPIDCHVSSAPFHFPFMLFGPVVVDICCEVRQYQG